jgi:predicted nucleic acid-binding protein
MSEKRKLYWDTSCFIAYISGSHPEEAHRTPICTDVMENAEKNHVEIWTSVLTIAEVIRRKLPAKKEPLPAWAEVIREKAPTALPYVQELWDFHDRKTAPTKALSGEEVNQLQKMFRWDFIHKIQVDERTAQRAVKLSQQYGLRPADAIHAASALLKPCDCIQHFDKGYGKIADLIQVEEPTRITAQFILQGLSEPAQP